MDRQGGQLPVTGDHALGGVFGAAGDPGGLLLGTQCRHVIEQNGLEAVAQRNEILGRQRLHAQLGEAAMQHTAAVAPHADQPVIDGQRVVAGAFASAQRFEQRGQGAGLARLAYPVALARLAGMLAVILAAVHGNHLHVLLQRGDSGQEALAIVAASVQLVRWLVGGGDQHHAFVEQRTKEPAEQHRIANVADEQFVEAQHADLAGQLAGQHGKRLGGAAQREQAAVHPLHEMMKVLPPRRYLQRLVETVHQPGLATADRPPQVDAQGWLPGCCMQRVVANLQHLCGA